MAEDNFPQLTEQLATDTRPEISAVDYIYNDIKSKAQTPSLLEQIDTAKNDADYFSGIFNSTETPKFSFNEDRININEAYTTLSDGTYITRYDKGFIKGADNEEKYAIDQSTGSKWVNGVGKFLGKTSVNVIGGTLGTAYGAIKAIADGNWERIYDNEFYDFLDNQNTKMDNFAANYRTQQERDMGFFESSTTANFWADDFLGGLSFLTGVVVSESIWAAATGGASLTTTASRVGLRGAKYFNTAKTLVKGVKEAQDVARAYNRLDAIRRSADRAVKFGKAGKVLNLARFTYTGAGFEAGMEARMYQKEQKENFYRDFETFNGRKPTPAEIAEFETNLNNTANSLWATNMALVGTSNFAILGKTFGITSPFKLQSKGLNKTLFGKGTTSTFGEAGERLTIEAVKRTKLQRGLGFSKSILKNPFYEGFVEEGGQAASSTSMESYLTSRYNPSEDAMDVAGSIYEGLSHTYGTKQGWKEVGLGALIGLVGGEGSTALSGGGLFTEAKSALKSQDPGSVAKAENQNQNLGTLVADRIFATKFEENLSNATELQDAQKEFDLAQDKGSVMEMANAQGRIMLTSVKNAVDFDYLNDQIKDFETGIKLQDPADVAEHYGIEESEVDAKIDELVYEYKELGEKYKSAKEFADYIISDNPKELFENGTPIDVRVARTAVAYQMVMTEIMEDNMQGAHEALIQSVSELNPQLASKYMQALNRFNQLNRSKKEDVEALAKAENKLKVKQEQLEKLNNQLLKVDQTKAAKDTEGNQKDSNRYNSIANRITEVEQDIATLTQDVTDKNARLNVQKTEMSITNSAVRQMAAQLDTVDPLAGEGLVSQTTIEDTRKALEELDATLEDMASVDPRLVERISRLAREYRKGLEMWQRNADTVADLTDPNLGLKRVGTMIQKKKKAGETTLAFLERLQKSQAEDLEFSTRIDSLVNNTENEVVNEGVDEEVNEQQKADENPGEDILQDTEDLDDLSEEEISNIENTFGVTVEKNVGRGSYFVEGENENNVLRAKGAIYSRQIAKKRATPTQQNNTAQDKVNELKDKLNKLVGENSFLLDNFTNNAQQLEQDKSPTQEDLNEYRALIDKFKSGNINNLVGKPVDQIGKRTKERSGLTDQEIQRYQDLSQKMLNWRIVTGTNSNGVSIQDILNQIAAYEQEVAQGGQQISTEQILEMTEQGQSEFSVDTTNPDFVNSMDKVNIKQDKIQTTISHLSIDTVIDSDFNVTYLREDNRGTEDQPDMARVYQLEKDGESFEIQYTNDHHRIVVPNKNTKAFLDGMGMQTVKYNTKTGWGFVFKDGVPMQSDFGINLINNPEINILNPQLIYELQPGDKLSFVVNMQDAYNNDVIVPMIQEGNTDTAKKLMSIYVVNSNGEVVGFLKAGSKGTDSNFNKLRDEAFVAIQERLENTDITLEDLANDNTNSVINLSFEVEVEKTFVGTPNIELNSDGSPKVFQISDQQAELIVGFGYVENGNLNEDPKVRKTFIPKKGSTPYVVIRHGETDVAFPVSLKPVDSTLQSQVIEILNSDSREQDKITQIISLLKQNGIEPAQFNLDSLKSNTTELDRLVKALSGAKRTLTKEDLAKMTIEDFISSAEIVIDLDKPAFVSPKVKMGLSKKLTNTKTNKSTASKKLSAKERQDLLAKHLTTLARAKSAEDVLRTVMETGDEVFIQEFLENWEFKRQVTDAALKSTVVPSINTESTMENLLQDVVDLDSDNIPLDIQEDFKDDLLELKSNPTPAKVRSLAKRIMKATENRYKLVQSTMDTNNLYHIPTTETEQQMFDQGYIRVEGDFYKKVDKKYDTRQLLEGLYNRYKEGTLPSHMNEDYLSLEDFIDQMPDTQLDIYKKYYNSQPPGPITKKSAIVGNEQYLREDFKGDFAQFIYNEKNKGSKLYKEVLQHFQITDKGILKDDILTREKIDSFEKELGDNYRALLSYSLINKHIDLQEQPQNVIFVEDVDDINRREAVNNPNLIEPKSKATIIDNKTISFAKVNQQFIKHNGGVYEQILTNKQGEHVYERIANIDLNFLITEVRPPFNTNTRPTDKEIDDTKTDINTTDGRQIDC